MGGLLLASNLVTLSSTAPTLALMIGLAVGIDYTLFILSRHRTQLAAGTDPEESAARATGTAGSAVVFAGLTVVIALSGLAVVGIPFLTVMGIGAAGTVLVAVLVALTLLPALLGFAGSRSAPKPVRARPVASGPTPTPTTSRPARSAAPLGRAGPGSSPAGRC
jgi:RND superfamily putative drug exporter